MTGLGITILVLLLVIGITCFVLRGRFGDQAVSWQRKRADKGKVRCYNVDTFVGSIDEQRCKNKASWVTPHGYFCDEHWEINSALKTVAGTKSRVRWAHQLNWRKKGTDVWTT